MTPPTKKSSKPPDMSLLRDSSQLKVYIPTLEKWATIAKNSGTDEMPQQDYKAHGKSTDSCPGCSCGMTCQEAGPLDEYRKCTRNTDCGESQLINLRGCRRICRMPRQDTYKPNVQEMEQEDLIYLSTSQQPPTTVGLGHSDTKATLSCRARLAWQRRREQDNRARSGRGSSYLNGHRRYLSPSKL